MFFQESYAVYYEMEVKYVQFSGGQKGVLDKIIRNQRVFIEEYQLYFGIMWGEVGFLRIEICIEFMQSYFEGLQWIIMK